MSGDSFGKRPGLPIGRRGLQQLDLRLVDRLLWGLVVDGGGVISAAADDPGHVVGLEGLIGVCDMVTLLRTGGVGEVEGVGFPASAQGHVSPFSTGSAADDGEGVVDGDSLGFVAG